MMFHWQKNCPMQKANGLQLKLSGASYSSLKSGMVLTVAILTLSTIMRKLWPQQTKKKWEKK